MPSLIKALFTLITCILSFAWVPAWQATVTAAKLTTRSVALSSSAPSAVADHVFRFDIPSSSTLGSIEFEYCANDPFVGTACNAPAGFSASAAVLFSQSGETGFSIDASSTANRLVITRAAVASSPGQVQYGFTNITNPSTPRQTVYVRVATFASTDGTGPRTDDGSVAFSLSGQLSTQGFVPPYIRFCVGLTVALDCSSASGDYLNLGNLSTSEAKFGTSQMAAFTNDESGYLISLFGTTMTSGNNAIPALASPQPSIPGTSQFGINLKDNVSPNVGQEADGIGTGTPQPGYDGANFYKFNQGDIIASSSIPTESSRYTVSYIVNSSASQPPGIYSTTVTYVASATF